MDGWTHGFIHLITKSQSFSLAHFCKSDFSLFQLRACHQEHRLYRSKVRTSSLCATHTHFHFLYSWNSHWYTQSFVVLQMACVLSSWIVRWEWSGAVFWKLMTRKETKMMRMTTMMIMTLQISSVPMWHSPPFWGEFQWPFSVIALGYTINKPIVLQCSVMQNVTHCITKNVSSCNSHIWNSI